MFLDLENLVKNIEAGCSVVIWCFPFGILLTDKNLHEILVGKADG